MMTTIAEERRRDSDDVLSTLRVSLIIPDPECGETWEMMAPHGAFVEGDPDEDDSENDEDEDFFPDDDDDEDDDDLDA